MSGLYSNLYESCHLFSSLGIPEQQVVGGGLSLLDGENLPRSQQATQWRKPEIRDPGVGQVLDLSPGVVPELDHLDGEAVGPGEEVALWTENHHLKRGAIMSTRKGPVAVRFQSLYLDIFGLVFLEFGGGREPWHALGPLICFHHVEAS